MLVLTREQHESIIIGNGIEIEILEVRGGKVRLGITAPKSISVHRKEIQLLVNEEKGVNNGVKSDLPGSTH